MLFWPVYGAAFFLLEHITQSSYHYVHCALDDVIPFCEIFVIPYYFWFVYIVGMLIYGLLFDTESFVLYMRMIIVTCSAACITYFIYPTAQQLRPEEFLRDNIFTQIVDRLYAFDTNTNVCPSIHVAGAVSVSVAAWNSKYFSKTKYRIIFTIITALICMSTVFLKQHSAEDVFWGLVLCAAAQTSIVIYGRIKEKEPKKKLFGANR